MRAENGEVRVRALHFLERVAVHDGETVVVILLRNKAAGILAERADLVFERRGIADELGLIEHLVDGLHDLIAHLDAHTDIHGAGLVGDAVLGAERFKPVRTAAARGDDRAPGFDLALLFAVGDDAAETGLVFEPEIKALPTEDQLHAVLGEIALNGKVNALGLLGTHVADRAVHKLETGLNGAAADVLHLVGIADALNVGVRAEFQIDGVGVVDGLLREPCADERRQIAADLVGEGELAVGESARAGKAGRDVAVGLAVHAPAGLGLGAVALLDALAFFHERDVAFVALADELQGGEYAGRTGADDQNIRFHASTFTFSMPCFSNSAKYSSMRAFSSSASSWLICSALMSRRASSSARMS